MSKPGNGELSVSYINVRALSYLDKNREPITPTEEQFLILDAAVNTPDSLLINSLAGCAKTSTLEFMCQVLPVMPILSLAFNKKIADEMVKRLPGHVTAKTINGLGHGVWSKYTNKRLIVDKDKIYNILKGLIEKASRQEKSELYESMADTLKSVRWAKMQGYIPDNLYPGANHLISSEEFYAGLNDQLDGDPDRELVDWLLNESIKMAYSGLIDFDDQIYMPTLFGGTFPQFPLIMVDEAQDLSPLNHAMLDKLVSKRIIAVGDPWQSIYAFRGADTTSMGRLKKRFNMKEMTLSVTFRCPINIVINAHWRVPDFKWAPWAKEGEVIDLAKKEEPGDWKATSIPPYSAIICRNNAPLMSCALKLLQYGVGCRLLGSDLGPGLIRTLKKLCGERMEATQAEAMVAVDEWEETMLRKRKNEGTVHDKADCLRVFIEFGATLGAAVAYAEHLFKTDGPIQLMSGHKSKGLEFDVVYHLDPWLVPSKWATGEALEQELNLKYVIETRAKSTLLKVLSSNLKQ